MKHIALCGALFAIALVLCAAPGFAAEPLPWQIGLQPPATPVKERIHDFHNMLLVIIIGIVLFVMALMIFIMIRFNAKANPEPSTTSHNVPLEIVWTIVPVIILVVIAVPSMKLLYYMDRVEEPEMTVKVIGHQWYWAYEYPDHDDFQFAAYMIPDDEIDPSKGQRRLLSTDNQLVLPVDTDIEILITAGDVIHSFAVPAFGIKTDAVPGRLNHTWVRITQPGTYYGQCSEICGTGHAYMPSEVRAVSKEDFEAWIAQAETGYLSYAEFEESRNGSAAR